MKTSEILQIEKNNTDSVFLFKEGVFWRCYEMSAFYFFKNIKEYRVFKKFIKVVNQEIIYLGFPDTIIEEIIQAAVSKNYSVMKNEKEIKIGDIKQETGFLKWKNNIELSKTEKPNHNNSNKIIGKIMGFDIKNSTPIEAFNFIAEIQAELSTS